MVMVSSSSRIDSLPHSAQLLSQIARAAHTLGLNLVGVVDAEEFDRSQPNGRRARELEPRCGSVLLLGSGGRACWERLRSELGPELEVPRPGHHPIDGWSAAVAADIVAKLRAAGRDGSVVMPNDQPTLNFVQLGEMAGLGTVSPVIHQLLHPEFGPWISLRAAVLIHGAALPRLLPEVTGDFQPCDECSRPCADACPAEAYSGDEPQLGACVEHRLDGGCASGCDVRRHCPIGQEHRYHEAEESFRHAYSRFMIEAMQRPARKGLFGRFRR